MDLEFSTVSFRDVDQFSEWAAGLGWDVESTQLSRGANRIGCDHFALPEVVVNHYQVQQSVHDVFALPDGFALFQICRVKQPVIWCGMRVLPSTLAIVRPGRTYWCTLPANLDCYEFLVSEELIRRTELIPPRLFDRATRIEDAFIPLVEPQTGHLLDGLDIFFRTERTAGGAVQAAVSGVEFYEFVLDGLHQVMEAGLVQTGSGSVRPTRRADLIPHAKDFMAAHLEQELTADEIAQYLGVSYRALNYAFRDAVGVSPYRYFLTQKLHRARRQLKFSDLSVTDALISNGFTHPSRFARHYKRLFGELPSETRMRR